MKKQDHQRGMSRGEASLVSELWRSLVSEKIMEGLVGI
jgi:hypothetical protein